MPSSDAVPEGSAARAAAPAGEAAPPGAAAAGAQARLDIAVRELENHRTQIAQSDELTAFMHEKFSNEALYDWMAAQASTAHFQGYLLAIDLARQAQACYRFERLPDAADFVRVEQWDGLAQGLLAGERLHGDLRRMEAAWLARNVRGHEIVKHVSLAELDPVALLLLQRAGECRFSLPEHVFDADHPGQFLRRLKSVSLSIPAVVGPYAGINARLSLERSEVRVAPEGPAAAADYARKRGANADDPRFRDIPSFVTAMVTSSGQSDSGLFELSLRDERYLPFEGAGAISAWRLELPKDTNRFDFASVSDVVVHLRYTARDGDDALRAAAWESTFQRPPPAAAAAAAGDGLAAPRRPVRMFSARREWPDAWHRFLNPADGAAEPVLELDLSGRRFPRQAGDGGIAMDTLEVLLVTTGNRSAVDARVRLARVADDGTMAIAQPAPGVLAAAASRADLASAAFAPAGNGLPGAWTLRVAAADNPDPVASAFERPAAGRLRVRAGALHDVLVLVGYHHLPP